MIVRKIRLADYLKANCSNGRNQLQVFRIDGSLLYSGMVSEELISSKEIEELRVDKVNIEPVLDITLNKMINFYYITVL